MGLCELVNLLGLFVRSPSTGSTFERFRHCDSELAENNNAKMSRNTGLFSRPNHSHSLCASRRLQINSALMDFTQYIKRETLINNPLTAFIKYILLLI